MQGAQEVAAQQQQNYNELIAKPMDDFRQYIQTNPINPNHFMESRTTGQKVGQAIGLLLGGAGSQGGPNPVYQYIQSQIDRDVAAQQHNVDNQKTLYGAYRDAYGDSKTAIAMAKASMNDLYDHQQKMMAAQLGTPQAMVNSQKLSAQLALD